MINERGGGDSLKFTTPPSPADRVPGHTHVKWRRSPAPPGPTARATLAALTEAGVGPHGRSPHAPPHGRSTKVSGHLVRALLLQRA
eukprot:8079975-Alexandrium_andersonii.AAC.1